MDNDEYLATQMIVMNISRMVQQIDFDGFLTRVTLAHTVGPIQDPTLYAQAMTNLKAVEKITRALREFKIEVQKVVGENDDEERKIILP